jgi:cell division septum initiation protein DivIVA
MIANNIDGSSGGSSQILELLSLVAADPKVYQSKLKALEDATAEHKKYVELVGPASDILTIKAKVKADLDEAATTLSDAKTEAKSIVSDAKEKAKNLIDTAQDSANILVEDAKSIKSQADADLLVAKKAQSKADRAQSKADSNSASAAEKSKLLDEAIADTNAAKEDAEAVKAEIIAKHKAFLESL